MAVPISYVASVADPCFQNVEITWHLLFELREITRNRRYVETSEDRFLWLAIEQESEGRLETTLRGMLAHRDIVTW
jgi:hypothetical protein